MEKELSENIRQNILEINAQISKAMQPISEKSVQVMKNLRSNLKPLIDKFKPIRAYSLLGNNQFTYWRLLSQEEIETIISSDDINEYLSQKIEDNTFENIDDVIVDIKKSNLLTDNNRTIIEQCAKAISDELYDLALIGIIAVFDSALSISIDDPNTSFTKRLEKVKKLMHDISSGKETFREKNLTLIGTYCSWKSTMDSLAKHSDFSNPDSENSNINRHWVMHGRKTSSADKLDCYKMINALYGLIILAEI